MEGLDAVRKVLSTGAGEAGNDPRSAALRNAARAVLVHAADPASAPGLVRTPAMFTGPRTYEIGETWLAENGVDAAVGAIETLELRAGVLR